jgi:hypothetical protein
MDCNCTHKDSAHCEDCGEIVCEHGYEMPDTCYGCERHWHAQCGRNGNIRYIPKMQEDYCFRCIPYKRFFRKSKIDAYIRKIKKID